MNFALVAEIEQFAGIRNIVDLAEELQEAGVESLGTVQLHNRFDFAEGFVSMAVVVAATRHMELEIAKDPSIGLVLSLVVGRSLWVVGNYPVALDLHLVEDTEIVCQHRHIVQWADYLVGC